MAQSQLTATSASWAQAVTCFSLPTSWNYRNPPLCTAVFVFLVERRFRPVGQAALKLLASVDPAGLGLPKCRDSRHEPLLLHGFIPHNSVFNFWELPYCFASRLCYCAFSAAVYKGSSFSTLLPTLTFCFNQCYPNR